MVDESLNNSEAVTVIGFYRNADGYLIRCSYKNNLNDSITGIGCINEDLEDVEEEIIYGEIKNKEEITFKTPKLLTNNQKNGLVMYRFKNKKLFGEVYSISSGWLKPLNVEKIVGTEFVKYCTSLLNPEIEVEPILAGTYKIKGTNDWLQFTYYPGLLLFAAKGTVTEVDGKKCFTSNNEPTDTQALPKSEWIFSAKLDDKAKEINFRIEGIKYTWNGKYFSFTTPTATTYVHDLVLPKWNIKTFDLDAEDTLLAESESDDDSNDDIDLNSSIEENLNKSFKDSQLKAKKDTSNPSSRIKLDAKINSSVELAVDKYASWYYSKTNTRGPQSYFAFLRHGKKGQLRAYSLLNELQNTENLKERHLKVFDYLKDPKTRYHRHSFASFLIDELSDIKPKISYMYDEGPKKGLYSKPKILEFISDMEAALDENASAVVKPKSLKELELLVVKAKKLYEANPTENLSKFEKKYLKNKQALYSFFKHKATKIDPFQQLLNEIKTSKDLENGYELINKFLANPKTIYTKFSAATFLINELKKVNYLFIDIHKDKLRNDKGFYDQSRIKDHIKMFSAREPKPQEKSVKELADLFKGMPIMGQQL